MLRIGPGQWNDYEITCLGQSYSVRINGELVLTWTDPKHRTTSGFIGLQNYNDGKTVRHRNLRIGGWLFKREKTAKQKIDINNFQPTPRRHFKKAPALLTAAAGLPP